MTERRAIPNVEVGYGTSKGSESFQVGVEAASSAVEAFEEHPLALMLVHVKGTHDVSSVLDGITTVTEDAPVIGITSKRSDESDLVEVSAIAIGTPFLTVSVGMGSCKTGDVETAAKEAMASEEMDNYFGENSQQYWKELVSIGKSAVGILLCTGEFGNGDLEVEKALTLLRENSDGQIPFIGGRLLFVSGKGAANLIYYDESYEDALLLLVLETNLRIGIGTADGLSSTPISMLVTKADQKEIIELDGIPARERLAQLEEPNIMLGIVDNLNCFRNIIFEEHPNSASLRVSTSQPIGTRLTVVKAEGNDLVEAGDEAFRKSVIRGNIEQPVLGIIFSSIFRRELLSNSVFDELKQSLSLREGLRIVGFDTDLEIGLTDEGLNRINKRTVSVLVLGSDLSYAAEVAMENKELVSKLQRAEASQRALLDLMPDAILATDTKLQITHWNPKVRELLGHEREAVMGLNVTRILHPRLRWTLENAAKELREEAVSGFKTFEAEVIRLDNTLVPVEVTVSFNPLQERYCYVIAIHDITEYKSAQSVLDRERNAYRIIAEAALDASSVEDLCQEILQGILETLMYDIGTVRLYNQDRNSLILTASLGMKNDDLVAELPVRPFEETGFLTTETAFSKTSIFAPDVKADPSLLGKGARMEAMGVEAIVMYPLTGSTGILLGVLNLASYTKKEDTTESKTFFEVLAGMFATVLERRMTQVALAESEMKYRTVLQSMRDIVFVFDEEDRYTECYTDDLSLLLQPPAELLGRHVSEVVPAKVASDILRALKKVRETEMPVTLDYALEIDGKMMWFSANMALHEDGKSIVSVSRDITARKIAETTLAKRMEYEKALADISQSLLMSNNLSAEAFQSALSILQSVSVSNRVYLFENIVNSDEELCMRLVSEVAGKDVSREGEDIGQFITPYSVGYKRWEKELSNGRIIMGKSKSFPDEERFRLESLNVKSVLVLPLWVQSKWYGFIGFDDTDTERDWTDDDVRLLRTASEMFSTYISRVSIENELRSSLRDLELYSSILRHDFANDVMVIMNQIEAGEILGIDEKRTKEIIEATKRSTERMAQVLTVFTAEGKQSRYHVRELLNSIVDYGKRTHPKMRIDLHFSGDSSEKFVSGGRLLPMVFSNLLRNVNDYVGEEAIVSI
ncbi:MAG: PAS domain S-box protein, partial [Candidatus Thorarchaeota archaeon]